MVDTRGRGKDWYDGRSFSLLWLGGGMHNKGMERPWWLLLGTEICQPKFGLLCTPVLGQKGLFLGNCKRKLS